MDAFGVLEWAAIVFVTVLLASPAIVVSMEHLRHWLRVRLRSRCVQERLDRYVGGKSAASPTPTEAR
jgi:hypothetical protein